MTKKSIRTQISNKPHNLHIFSMIALFMTLVSLSATLYISAKYNKLADENASLKTGYSVQKWQPKQEVKTPNFAITVEGLLVDDKGIPEHLPLPEGYVFVAIDVTAQNLTAEEKLFLPQDHTYIKDERGMRYDVTAATNVENGVAGAVLSGDKIRGQIGFMVPEGQKNLTFYFEPYGDGAGKTAAFDLSSLL